MAESQALGHRQVHVEKCREKASLHDISGIGGAPLLRVFEALGEVGPEEIPLREVPDTPGIEPLLLEDVPLACVGQGGCCLAPIRATADESQCSDLLRANQHVTEFAAHS